MFCNRCIGKTNKGAFRVRSGRSLRKFRLSKFVYLIYLLIPSTHVSEKESRGTEGGVVGSCRFLDKGFHSSSRICASGGHVRISGRIYTISTFITEFCIYVWELINYISEISFILPIARVIFPIFTVKFQTKLSSVSIPFIFAMPPFVFQKKSVKFNILSL